jgi:hypothetical protein
MPKIKLPMVFRGVRGGKNNVVLVINEAQKAKSTFRRSSVGAEE